MMFVRRLSSEYRWTAGVILSSLHIATVRENRSFLLLNGLVAIKQKTYLVKY